MRNGRSPFSHLTPKLQEAFLQGQGVKAAARRLNVPFYFARHVYRAMKRAGRLSEVAPQAQLQTQPQTQTQSPPNPADIDRPVRVETPSGMDTSLWTDRPLSEKDMAELFGVNLDEWISTHKRGNVWQGFYKLRDHGHQKVTLYQTTVSWKRKIDKPLRDAVFAFCQQVPPAQAAPLPTRATDEDPQWAILGLWDVHIGMLAWANEVGTSYDVNIAVSRVCNAIDSLLADLRRYNVTEIILPIGNDWVHYDNVRRLTSHGDHRLDGDTRFTHVYTAALKCAAYLCDASLQVADKVEMLWIPGNHDAFASFTICAALKQRYANEPRFAADVTPGTRKYVNRGSVYVGFDHGKDVRATQLANIFPREARVNWDKCTYCEVQVGHTHQKRVETHFESTPTNGVAIVTNPSLSNIDSYHHQHGFIGEPMKSAEAYRYGRTGRLGSHVAWADDRPHKMSAKT